jgi:hypothetical protein
MAAGLGTGFTTAAFATAGSAAAAAAPATVVAPPAPGTAPAAYLNTNTGAAFAVYTGTDSAVWQKQIGATTFATSLGGRLISAPAPIFPGSSRIVFGVGTDHALWEKIAGGAWTSLGGYLTSKPGAAASSSTDYRVYARGGDGALWARSHTSSGWSGWYTLGGRLLAGTGPGAAVGPSTSVVFKTYFYVLVAGTNHGLFLIADGAGGFSSAGGVTTASPALTNDPSTGLLEGFAQGTDRAGYCAPLPSRNPPTWVSMGGILTSGMGASSTSNLAASQSAASPSSAAIMRGGSWAAYSLGTDTQVWQQQGTDNTPSGAWTRVTP